MRCASSGRCHRMCCSSRQSNLFTARRPLVYAATCHTTPQQSTIFTFTAASPASIPSDEPSQSEVISGVCRATEMTGGWSNKNAPARGQVPSQGGGLTHRLAARTSPAGSCARPTADSQSPPVLPPSPSPQIWAQKLALLQQRSNRPQAMTKVRVLPQGQRQHSNMPVEICRCS